MSETTEVRKCPVCEGLGVVSIPMNSDAGVATTQCKTCSGAGVIITDIVTPFIGDSEQFPDKEIYRMGTEQFDEVFEDKVRIYEWGGYFWIKPPGFYLQRSFQNDDKVKISCRLGKIVIERLDK